MNTAWTASLARQGAAASVPEEGTTTVAPLPQLGLLRSHGEDSTVFLHNLLSNDIKKLAADAAELNSFNTPKGRMLASLLVWREDDDHLIALSADILPAIQKKLSMYVLRSKVKLSDASEEFALAGLAGPHAVQALTAAGLPVPPAPRRHAPAGEGRVIRLTGDAFIIVQPPAAMPVAFEALVSAGARPASPDAWTLATIRAGLPLITAATQEAFVAQMLNYELIGGVSFQKGCYPGQEIVARMQYLGKPKKRMFHVHIDTREAPTPGADLYAPDFGEQSAGQLVNAAPAPQGGFEALAVLQTGSRESGEVLLGSLQGPALRFLDLPYDLP